MRRSHCQQPSEQSTDQTLQPGNRRVGPGAASNKKKQQKKEEAQNSLDSIIKELMAVKMKHLNALMEAEQSPAEGLS